MLSKPLRVLEDLERTKERVTQLEGVVYRLMDIINTMQQKRKPGRKPVVKGSSE